MIFKKPSVTKLISLLDKPALLLWANKKGLEGINISIYSTEKKSNGSKYHNMIVDSITNGSQFGNTDEFKKFIDFFSDKEIISYEKDIETDHFVGRYDMKFIYNNKTYIVDFKTRLKKIYLEHKLQLCAYAMAENCDSIAVVSIPDFRMEEIIINDKKPYNEIIINLSNIYKLKQQIEYGKL